MHVAYQIFGALTTLPAEVKSQDAVHVLSYAIIMLNTDSHNPQVRVSNYHLLRGSQMTMSYRNG